MSSAITTTAARAGLSASSPFLQGCLTAFAMFCWSLQVCSGLKRRALDRDGNPPYTHTAAHWPVNRHRVAIPAATPATKPTMAGGALNMSCTAPNARTVEKLNPRINCVYRLDRRPYLCSKALRLAIRPVFAQQCGYHTVHVSDHQTKPAVP